MEFIGWYVRNWLCVCVSVSGWALQHTGLNMIFLRQSLCLIRFVSLSARVWSREFHLNYSSTSSAMRNEWSLYSESAESANSHPAAPHTQIFVFVERFIDCRLPHNLHLRWADDCEEKKPGVCALCYAHHAPRPSRFEVNWIIKHPSFGNPLNIPNARHGCRLMHRKNWTTRYAGMGVKLQTARKMLIYNVIVFSSVATRWEEI